MGREKTRVRRVVGAREKGGRGEFLGASSSDEEMGRKRRKMKRIINRNQNSVDENGVFFFNGSVAVSWKARDMLENRKSHFLPRFPPPSRVERLVFWN